MILNSKRNSRSCLQSCLSCHSLIVLLPHRAFHHAACAQDTRIFAERHLREFYRSKLYDIYYNPQFPVLSNPTSYSQIKILHSTIKLGLQSTLLLQIPSYLQPHLPHTNSLPPTKSLRYPRCASPQHSWQHWRPHPPLLAP